MPLYNIFQKDKTREENKKDEQKPKVIADYRERNSLVASELISLGIDVEFKELKVADYIVKNTAIERKTVNDFISSMINKRLIRQLEEIQQYENRLLIIEGTEEQELYNDEAYKENKSEGINPNAIRGMILSIILRYKVPIILTKTAEDTAKFISLIAKKQEKESSLNPKKKARNKKEQQQYILEGFPGIGAKTAKKLLKEFKSIKDIINTDEQELKKILGKKSTSFKSLIEDNY